MTAPERTEAVVLVSGGLDSCVAMAWAAAQGWELRALHVSYGQRTAHREARAYGDIADHYRVSAGRRLAADMQYLARIGGSSLTDARIEVEEADLERGGIPSSYVPFRNTHLLSIAASWAEVTGAQFIVIGAVHEDSSGYPDCRPEYFEAFNALLRVGTAAGAIRVVTPVIGFDKASIVRLGVKLGAPLHATWSCYQDEGEACGTCDSCALRLRGFQQAGVPDPIPYRTRPSYI
jgi:7-cyano-7-deazaguanine synthase